MSRLRSCDCPAVNPLLHEQVPLLARCFKDAPTASFPDLTSQHAAHALLTEKKEVFCRGRTRTGDNPSSEAWQGCAQDYLPTADPKGQRGHSLRTSGRGFRAESFTPKQDQPPAATGRGFTGSGQHFRPPLQHPVLLEAGVTSAPCA